MGPTIKHFRGNAGACDESRLQVNATAGIATKSRLDPVISRGVPAELFQNLTPWAKREIRRRKKILARFNELTTAGWNKRAAAKQLRQSIATLWRWHRQLVPQQSHCGTKPAIAKFDVPADVIDRVERLQLAGKSNADAWRAVGREKICPPALAKYLRSARNIPPSFLRVTKLSRRKATVIEGRGFTTIQP